MRLRLLLLAMAALAGCATPESLRFAIEDPLVRSAWSSHEKNINAIERWRISGRFGASTETDAWSGSLSWQQHNEEYSIQLSGPLNQGAIALNGNNDYSLLKLDDNQSYINSDAEKLLQLHTGMQLPINGLKYWIKGIPSPQKISRNAALDENGHLLTLREGHWQIDFKGYKTYNGISLPVKIFLQHDHVSVRLVVDNWQIDG